MRILIWVVFFFVACGSQTSGSGKKDPEVGGEELLKTSFYCEKLIPVEGPSGKDEVRHFELSLTAFVYAKGSVASTLKSSYTFKDKSTYDETVTGIFAQDEKARIDSDFFVVKIDREKEAEVYPKFELGESYQMDCK